MRSLERHIERSITDIIGEVVALSSDAACIFSVVQQSVSRAVTANFENISMKGELEQFVDSRARAVFIETRFRSLFDLIAAYPDSEPAFHELSSVLQSDNLQCSLCDLSKWSLESCRAKLLSPAIPTETIIGQFVHGAAMFRLIDPTGLLLDRTSNITKEYLYEKRAEAEIHASVFKLLCALLDVQEPKRIIRFDVKHEEYLDFYEVSSEHDHWLPDPPAAGKTPIRASSKSFDPFSVLVNFSDHKNLFKCLHELVMKLIVSGHCAPAKILKRIGSFAKCLFGQAQCSKLLVMLHDAQQSKELFGRANTEAGGEPAQPLIISNLYWPLSEEWHFEASLPSVPNLDTFKSTFSRARPGRTLKWIAELSCVDIDLRLDEINYSLNAIPIHAYSVMQRLLKTPLAPSQLTAHEKDGIIYWAERGFCQIDSDNQVVLCKPSTNNTITDLLSLRAHLFDTENDSASKPSTKIAKIPPHIPAMVSAMLTNLGPMPAARIHAMLVAMLGLRDVDVAGLTEWLLGWTESVQYDPVTGVFCRQVKTQ
jgi:hypothetical protein